MMDQLLIDTEHFTLSSWEFFVRLLVSIGIGVVIGLERQYNAMMEHANGYFWDPNFYAGQDKSPLLPGQFVPLSKLFACIFPI